MEEHMKQYVIGLIVFLVVVALSGCANMENQLSNTTEPETLNNVEVAQPQNNVELKQDNDSSIKTTITPKGIVLNEEYQLNDFPEARTLDLEVGRYRVTFETDYNVQFVMYSEDRYNQWMETGEHTLSKISTKEGTKCCDMSGSYVIDINNGEAGTYYFVFDTSKVSGQPTQGKILVEKITDL